MQTILAIDVGYGNTKAVWNRRDLNGKVVWDEICFPSAANKIFRDHSIEGVAGPDRVLVDVNGALFFVGPEATTGAEQLVGGIAYITKPEYEALLCGARSYMMKRMARVPSTLPDHWQTTFLNSRSKLWMPVQSKNIAIFYTIH